MVSTSEKGQTAAPATPAPSVEPEKLEPAASAKSTSVSEAKSATEPIKTPEPVPAPQSEPSPAAAKVSVAGSESEEDKGTEKEKVEDHRPQVQRAESLVSSTSAASTPSLKQAESTETIEHRKVEVNFSAIITSPIVALLLGGSRVTYRIHVVVMSKYHKLLELIPTGDDGKKIFDKEIELLHDDPEAFACLVEFLYKGEYAPTFASREYKDEKAKLATPNETVGENKKKIEGHWVFHSNHLNKYNTYNPSQSSISTTEDPDTDSLRSHELKLLQAKVWALARMYNIPELENQAWAKLTFSSTLNLHGPRRFLRFYSELARVIESRLHQVLLLEAEKRKITEAMQHATHNKDGTPSEDDLESIRRKLSVEMLLTPIYNALKALLALWTKLVKTEWSGPSSPATITKGCMIGWLYTSVSSKRWKDCIATNPFLKHYLRCFDGVHGFTQVPEEVEADFVRKGADGKIWAQWDPERVVLKSNWDVAADGKLLLGAERDNEKKRLVAEGLEEWTTLMSLGRWCLRTD